MVNQIRGGQLDLPTIEIQPSQLLQQSAVDGDVLTWNNTAMEWEPQAPSGGTGTVTVQDDGANDVTGVDTLNFGTNLAVTDDGGGIVTIDATGSGGSAIILDLGDDGSNESIDLAEIATTNDTNNIFTHPVQDKLLIDVSQNWPTADTATTANNLATNALDDITEIDAAVRTGADATLVTGTAGTDGNLIQWNIDGDAVDSGTSTTSVITSSDSIDRLNDVDTTSTLPSDGDVLTFNNSTSNWEPQVPSVTAGRSLLFSMIF